MSSLLPGATRGGKPGWRIGTVGGSPVYLAPSWLLVAVILTVLFLPTVRSAAPGLGTPAAIAAAATFPVLLFASVLFHELAHGAAARVVGVPVKEYVLTFWGGHTSFGSDLGTPGRSAFVSAAGPLANIVLAVAGWVVLQGVSGLGGIVAVILAALVYANGIVAVFNLLPGNPLDGGRILEALIWKVTGNRDTGTIGAGWVGRVLAIVIAVVLVGRPFLEGRQPSVYNVVWGLLVAGLIWNGASQSIRLGTARRSASGFDLRALLRPAVVVGVDQPLSEVPTPRWGVVVGDVVAVDSSGFPVAVIDQGALAAVPREAYAATPVAAVARRLPPEAVLTALQGADALAAIARGLGGSDVVVVTSPGGILGTATRDAIITSLQRR